MATAEEAEEAEEAGIWLTSKYAFEARSSKEGLGCMKERLRAEKIHRKGRREEQKRRGGRQKLESFLYEPSKVLEK